MAAKRRTRPSLARNVKLPRIGPCQDPLALWFLEWEDKGQRWRTYHADRAAARVALRKHKGGA